MVSAYRHAGGQRRGGGETCRHHVRRWERGFTLHSRALKGRAHLLVHPPCPLHAAATVRMVKSAIKVVLRTRPTAKFAADNITLQPDKQVGSVCL